VGRDDLPDAFPSLADAAKAAGDGGQFEGPLAVCIVTAEVIGPVNNGGIGTAYTTLAQRLAAAGHNVTIMFTMGMLSQKGPWKDHVEDFARQGIRLEGLYRPGVRHIPRHMLESYELWRFLKAEHFDVVHIHDYQGAGYYPLLAKQQGLGLQGTAFVLGCHGPTMWAKSLGNQEVIDKIGDLEMDYMERKSVEMADYVVSPSHYLLTWMSKEGWPANPQTFVQPNLLPTADRAAGNATAAARGPRPVRELVFFGRMETRKGVIAFCDAMDRLLAEPGLGVRVGDGGLERVTFLGRGAMVLGKFGVQYVQERAQTWGIPWKVVTRLGPVEAKEYLKGEGRLAVMPSRIENSPYVVYECAELGIPFVASNVGGVPDLVHPDDHALALIPPTVDALVDALANALKHGQRAARPRVQAERNEREVLEFHNFVGRDMRAVGRAAAVRARRLEEELPFVTAVITHFNRPDLVRFAIEGLEQQDYPPEKYEVILYDDGSTQAEALAYLDEVEPAFAARGWKVVRGENCYLGCARNRAIKHARGEYVLFMDDDNIAKPHELRTYAVAMESSGADVLTSFVDFFWGTDRAQEARDRPSYMFLGGSADVGAFKNCFGDANSFHRVSSFEKIGGYTEDYGVGFEDWEMYANASLRGFKVDIVPESLYHYRFTKGSMQKSTDFFRNRRRSLRPYLNSLPQQLHQVILNAVFPKKADGSIGKSRGLAAEGTTRFPGVTAEDGTPLAGRTGVAGANPGAADGGAFRSNLPPK